MPRHLRLLVQRRNWYFCTQITQSTIPEDQKIKLHSDEARRSSKATTQTLDTICRDLN